MPRYHRNKRFRVNITKGEIRIGPRHVSEIRVDALTSESESSPLPCLRRPVLLKSPLQSPIDASTIEYPPSQRLSNVGVVVWVVAELWYFPQPADGCGN